MDGDDLASRVMGAQQKYENEITGILTQQQPYGLPPGELLGMPTPYVPPTPLLPELPGKEPMPPSIFPPTFPPIGPTDTWGRCPTCGGPRGGWEPDIHGGIWENDTGLYIDRF